MKCSLIGINGNEIRLRARILEFFSSKCPTELSTCYEDILKKDPTCNHSLARLISMHTNGNYETEQLLEMIALHLDATYASSCIWEELASCLLRLQTMLESQFEEDRMSTGQHTNYTGCIQPCFLSRRTFPRAFINGDSRKSWKLRCRWWRTRHFSKSTFLSETQAGDWELLTFKAACASHLYGPQHEYVASVLCHLDEEWQEERIWFLQNHIQISLKVYENLTS